MRRFLPAAALALAAAAPVLAQTSGAVLQREQKPTYPEGLVKIGKQGNVLLSGRIDASGKVQDVVALVATNIGFVDNAIAAVKNWQFNPAMRNGKPVDVAANIALRFRLEGPKRGEIPRAILGDLAIFPANASGTKTAPDGFPLKRGADPRLRVQAELDVPPDAKAQQLPLRADAVSPTGRKVSLYAGTVNVPANAKTVKIMFSGAVGADWEDGIWSLQTTLADVPSGSGQFWIAGDPEHFDFATLTARNAAAAVDAPVVPAPGPTAKAAPNAAPAPTKPPSKSKRA